MVGVEVEEVEVVVVEEVLELGMADIVGHFPYISPY